MRPIRLPLALLVTLVLALAGCGGGDDGGGGSGGGGGGGGGAEPTASPQEAFSTSCGNCHTLAAAGSEGQVGPDLDELQPSAEEVRTAIAEGPSVMPENILEGAEADAVAQYVADNAGG